MSDRYARHVVVISPEDGLFRTDCLCGWFAGPRMEGEAQDAARSHGASTSDLVELYRREAQLSREATEKAVRSRIARHEIERALRAVDTYDDVASDEDVLFHDGAAHAVRVIREMLGLDV